MNKRFLVILTMGVTALSFGQQKNLWSTTVLDTQIRTASNIQFLEFAFDTYQLDQSTSAAFAKERSILKLDIKPLKTEPDFILSDRNQFANRYKISNPAFYEALKNTTYSQLYNPFSLYKPL